MKLSLLCLSALLAVLGTPSFVAGETVSNRALRGGSDEVRSKRFGIFEFTKILLLTLAFVVFDCSSPEPFRAPP